jgi:hypothetical protein
MAPRGDRHLRFEVPVQRQTLRRPRVVGLAGVRHALHRRVLGRVTRYPIISILSFSYRYCHLKFIFHIDIVIFHIDDVIVWSSSISILSSCHLVDMMTISYFVTLGGAG